MEAHEVYTMTFHPKSTALPPVERLRLLRRFDEITDLIWQKNPDYYVVRQDFFFNDDTGVVLAETGGDIVGFYIYRRMRVGAERVLYGAATAIVPAYQGQGIRTRLFPRFLAYEQEVMGDGPLYLAFRTRNPITWHLVVKYHLKSVVPNLTGHECDPALVELGRRVAKLLYPDLTLEIPSMVMRGTHTTSYTEEPRHADPAFNDAFYAVLANKTDAIFSIGEVRRS